MTVDKVRPDSEQAAASLEETILHRLDLLDQSFARLPESLEKARCVDLLMKLRFEATQATQAIRSEEK